jgi:hypothetical protein
MKRMVMAALMAGATALPREDAAAQPHAPSPPWQDPAGPPTEMDVWLTRLVGRFRFEGLIHVRSQGDCEEPGSPLGGPCETIAGVGDCVSVGTGPGVQCVFNVSWLDIHTSPNGVSYLNPAMALFGLDPANGAINHLLVNNKGLAEGGMGASTGNRATFRTSCVNQPGMLGGCERIFRIEAAPDARILYMWIDVETGLKGVRPPVSITLSLRRVVQDEGIPLPAPAGRRSR